MKDAFRKYHGGNAAGFERRAMGRKVDPGGIAADDIDATGAEQPRGISGYADSLVGGMPGTAEPNGLRVENREVPPGKKNGRGVLAQRVRQFLRIPTEPTNKSPNTVALEFFGQFGGLLLDGDSIILEFRAPLQCIGEGVDPDFFGRKIVRSQVINDFRDRLDADALGEQQIQDRGGLP